MAQGCNTLCNWRLRGSQRHCHCLMDHDYSIPRTLIRHDAVIWFIYWLVILLGMNFWAWPSTASLCESLSRCCWWGRLHSVSHCGLFSPPFGLLWGGSFETAGLCGTLFEVALAGSVVFAFKLSNVYHTYCIIFLISCTEGLPWHVPSLTLVCIHRWRLCTNRGLKMKFFWCVTALKVCMPQLSIIISWIFGLGMFDFEGCNHCYGLVSSKNSSIGAWQSSV